MNQEKQDKNTKILPSDKVQGSVTCSILKIF